MTIRKPLVNIAGFATEMPVTDTIQVAEPTGTGQPVLWEQHLADTYFVGQYLTCGLSGLVNNSSQAFSANTLFASPIRILRTITLNQIASVVTTAAAGGLYRIGIYRSNGSLYPSTLVAGTDSGTFSSAATGNPVATINTQLTPGLYFIVFTSSIATAAFRALPVGVLSRLLGDIGPNFGTSSGATAYTVTFTFAALPATFPGSAARLSQAVPVIGIRVASIP